MQQTITYKLFEINPRLKKPELWIGIFILAIGLSVFQDYVYSQVKNTGFYLSESLLYNCIWIFLVPLSFMQVRLLKHFKFNRNFQKIGVSIVSSGVFTLLHIFIFTTFFVAVSYFAFSPTHHFTHIFNAALSNQFSILALLYIFVHLISQTVNMTKKNIQNSAESIEKINVKVGLKTISLPVDSIEFISTEKPYSVINSIEKKYLDNRTLKEFETVLNTYNFIRVHRSAIINKDFIKELKSRQNGDYDCVLESGKIIRLSRHYRTNWKDLLH
ncbi:LytTR family transcriptional regulator [bacterium]|nr:LytTR family transcriptional regulator [bacterium]